MHVVKNDFAPDEVTPKELLVLPMFHPPYSYRILQNAGITKFYVTGFDGIEIEVFSLRETHKGSYLDSHVASLELVVKTLKELINA